MSASSMYHDLRCRRTESIYQEWDNCLNHTVSERIIGDMVPASTRLRSCWKKHMMHGWGDATYYQSPRSRRRSRRNALWYFFMKLHTIVWNTHEWLCTWLVLKIYFIRRQFTHVLKNIQGYQFLGGHNVPHDYTVTSVLLLCASFCEKKG